MGRQSTIVATHAGPSLPGLRTVRGKYVAGALGVTIAALLYVSTNRWHGTATQLTLTAIDRMIPFVPETVWLYAASYLLLLWAFVGSGLPTTSRLLYALLSVQVVAAVIFVAYPVVYPRALSPVPSDTAPMHAAMVDFWRGIDKPANCLPSLHVTTNLLCAAVFHTGRLRRWRVVAWVVALLSIASTLTFKQHYVVDLVAGLALSAAAYVVFFRWVRVGDPDPDPAPGTRRADARVSQPVR